MMSPVTIFREGCDTFGILFPVLFSLAFSEVYIMVNESLHRMSGRQITSSPENIRSIEQIYTIATLTGSLQTIISLCGVGYLLWSGHINVGVEAFSMLVQGFASTGFGIATAIIGMLWCKFNQTPITPGKEASCPG